MKPHYTRIRRVKTSSGATAIQVGFYQGKKFILKKHVGSARETTRITELEKLAQEYIQSQSPQLPFNFNPVAEEVLYKRGLAVQQSRLTTAYDYLARTYAKLGFDQLKHEVLKHLVLVRVLEPASKLRSLHLLKKYFGVDYKMTTVFRQLEEIANLKNQATRLAITYAKKHLGFDFSLVFYDVTTLYFETHESDELRKNGFSKDNKINQPQVLVGLMVNQTGFPVYFDLFAGNTFEGHTIIPLIKKLKSEYHIQRLTVVADAGMLSEANLSALADNQIDYIVGARIKRLSLAQVAPIVEQLHQTSAPTLRQANLIWEYSATRAKKDKADNDKQLKKAEFLLHHPGQVTRRSIFLTTPKNQNLSLNQETVTKYRLLEGVKAYQTNITDLPDQLLVDRYRDLWHVEQSFRIAKSDLAARPIYHRQETTITAHLLLVFLALCLIRVIEQEKQTTVARVMEELRDMWTITLKDDISGNAVEVVINTKPH